MLRKMRVLLAEDDGELRSAMSEALREGGIDVVDVPDGAEVRSYMDDAIFFDMPKPRVHALVTDLAMPEMSGPKLLEYLDDLGHALPTIVVTGLTSDVVDWVAEQPTVRAVLQKPFELEELVAALRDALGRWGEEETTS